MVQVPIKTITNSRTSQDTLEHLLQISRTFTIKYQDFVPMFQKMMDIARVAQNVVISKVI